MSTPTEGNLAVEPEWRREVSTRLHTYRERRHGSVAAELQSTLPFEPPSDSQNRAETAPLPPALAVRASRPRKQRAERFEISIPMHETSPAASRLDRPASGGQRAGAAQEILLPVASLAERRMAALLDISLLLFSYGGMLALFFVLGGRIGFNKLDALVTGATLVMFYAQYFALFTIFGGSTPGMMVRGLRVVSFDGTLPTARQMAWRSFGYLISAGTCFLGFLWALWDEDQLCWQDRISQTYITPVEQFAPADSGAEEPRAPETSARR
ncbi:MAG: RDD family protein [Candidatus Acidiferrales bacterium]